MARPHCHMHGTSLDEYIQLVASRFDRGDDSSFGLTEATVICHQLGYTGASSYSRTRDDT